jgi:c-di-GMP-related signal transduction protein
MPIGRATVLTLRIRPTDGAHQLTSLDVAVARQAIFDRNMRVYGYELLFRPIDGGHGTAPDRDPDRMTSTVLFSSVSVGFDRLVGDAFAFCNGGRGPLTGSVPVTLPADRTVVEVLETVTPDEDVIAGCRRLVAAGYRLALDDFTWFDGAEPLLELASIVKLDLRLTALADLPSLIGRCRAFDVELLAEKIETEEELSRCIDLGFDYFQGYALSRPRLVPGRTMDSSAMSRLRIATALMTEDFELDQIEQMIRTEPAMSYQLLQLAGIGGRHGTRRKIRTLREALVLVGSKWIQNWLALLMLTHSGSPSTEDVIVALIRARMSELLARPLGPPAAELAFTAGMLSAFDMLLGVPSEEVVRGLSLDKELVEAAFGDHSPIGRLVRDVIDHQSGLWGRRTRSGITGDDLNRTSIQALGWALEATSAIEADDSLPGSARTSLGWDHGSREEPGPRYRARGRQPDGPDLQSRSGLLPDAR